MGAFSRGKDRTCVPQVRLTGEPDSLNNHCSGGRVNVKVLRSEAEEIERPGDVAADGANPGGNVGVAGNPECTDRQVA